VVKLSVTEQKVLMGNTEERSIGGGKGKGGFLKGAAWIALGGFIAKVIGGLYRIPLANILGGEGIGLYQLVYAVYCLFLTVAATGIPSSVAKLTAERIGKGESALPLLKKSLSFFSIVGVVASLVMAILAPFLAKAQGAGSAVFGYYVLAPSVAFVTVISVFRGYFQGKNDMLPTAISEVAEQVVKVGLGLLFAYLFRGDLIRTVFWLLVAVSLSESFTALLLYAVYRRSKSVDKVEKDGGRYALKDILRLSIPVTLSGILLPASALLDSVLAPRFMSVYAENSVALYGLFAGGAVTLINLPVSMCYGLAAASVPIVSAAVAEGRKGGARRRIRFSLFVTAAFALPCAVGLYAFADIAVKIVYRNLAAEELQTLISLTRVLSVSAFTLSCAQTLSACLTAQGKPQYAAVSWFVAMAVKTICYYFWLKKPSVSVFGLAYATNLAYLVAFLLNLMYNFFVTKKTRSNE
jgi:stage V sporulation protein B